MPKLTLTYFPIGGRGDPARLACVVGKLPFTNKNMGWQEWPTLKAQYPMGKIPLLEVDDVRVK